ncbi:MAG: hypothetical protein LBR73_01645 [Oscillospiraceae bacterium]|jgi:hypothetical protein|nr:hypothetical protein [Oscillospiraceae bacterium]
MVIRITRAGKFALVCVLLVITAVIALKTSTITVSTPYSGVTAPVPILVYRSAEGKSPVAATLTDVQQDVAFLKDAGYAFMSEEVLMGALRSEKALPGKSVLLVFDENLSGFNPDIQAFLAAESLSWFTLDEAGTLMDELRAAGCPITKLERSAGVSLESYEFS